MFLLFALIAGCLMMAASMLEDSGAGSLCSGAAVIFWLLTLAAIFE